MGYELSAGALAYEGKMFSVYEEFTITGQVQIVAIWSNLDQENGTQHSVDSS